MPELVRYEAEVASLQAVNILTEMNASIQQAKGFVDDTFLFDVAIHIMFYLREQNSKAESVLAKKSIRDPSFSAAERAWLKIYHKLRDNTSSDVELRYGASLVVQGIAEYLSRALIQEVAAERREQPQEICRLPMADRRQT